MNKLILFIFLLISTTKSNAQCTFSFDDLFKSINFSFSEFETFALNNGYSYDSTKNSYTCDNEYIKNWNLYLLRNEIEEENKKNKIIIVHVFYQKSIYLDYKSKLETNNIYNSSGIKNETLIQTYIYNGKLIQLSTKTEHDVNVYTLAISSRL